MLAKFVRFNGSSCKLGSMIVVELEFECLRIHWWGADWGRSNVVADADPWANPGLHLPYYGGQDGSLRQLRDRRVSPRHLEAEGLPTPDNYFRCYKSAQIVQIGITHINYSQNHKTFTWLAETLSTLNADAASRIHQPLTGAKIIIKFFFSQKG